MSSTSPRTSTTRERKRPFLTSALPPAATLRARAAGDASPDWLLTTVLLVLGGALSAITILRGIGPHDEGLMLQAGSRIANGQWPYRDFWTNYPPGQPLLLALLQLVFGPSLLAWRVLRVITNAIVALLAFRLAYERAGQAIALLAWLAVAGAMAFPTGPGPNPTAIGLALGSILLARATSGPRRRARRARGAVPDRDRDRGRARRDARRRTREAAAHRCQRAVRRRRVLCAVRDRCAGGARSRPVWVLRHPESSAASVPARASTGRCDRAS